MMKKIILLLTVSMFACSSFVTAADPLAEVVKADWQRQEQLLKRTTDTPEVVQMQLDRAGKLIALLPTKEQSKPKQQLAKLASELEKAGTDKAKLTALYNEVRELARDAAFANPVIDFDSLLFVRRTWPKHAHQCSHRVGEPQTPNADLCVLEGLHPDGKVRSLLGTSLKPGGIGRPALSYDAKKVVFPYAEPRFPATRYGSNAPGVRGGTCQMYDIYEVDVDGPNAKKPRNLTNSLTSEDTEPCYLPNGRIAFTSSRKNRFVQCGDWALVFGIHTMNPDGSDVRSITEEQDTEFYPAVLPDGRILYTRWDYLMKSYNVIQQVWAVNPDGTRPQLVYGDHYEFSRGPYSFQEARPIPGTSKLVSIGAAHHNSGVGPVMITDMAKNRGGPDGMVCLTPEVGYPEATTSNTRSKGGWYSSPFPLSEELFLVTFAYEEPHNTNTYALYLMDIYGGKELVYRSPKDSCYSPIPLRPRKKERIIPSLIADVPVGTPGTMTITDIYQGLDGIKRGEVKYLRICQLFAKTEHTVPQRVDLGVGCGWDLRGVYGTVPVESDGSAHFELPSSKMFFFEALDKDYLEIRRMRNYVNMMPGEKSSCVGCHEPFDAAASTAKPLADGSLLAMRRPASKITAPPWGGQGRGFSFTKYVQPVLDKNCIKCHDGKEKEKGHAFDLRGGKLVTAPHAGDRDQGPQHAVSTSFLNLLPHVSYLTMTGHRGLRTPAKVKEVGSGVSELFKVLKEAKQHKDLKLPQDDWRALAAWVDLNAPFIGGYDEIFFSKETAPKVKVPASKSAPTQTPPPKEVLLKDANGRKKELAAEAAKHQAKLVAYLDCGGEKADGAKGQPRLELLQGNYWLFYSGNKPAHPRYARIWWDNNEVKFRVTGLQKGKNYTLGLTWWDHNYAGRKQSVTLRPKNGKAQTLIAPERLPDWKRFAKLPTTKRVPFTGEGEAEIVIEKRGDANVVVSEIWLEEK